MLQFVLTRPNKDWNLVPDLLLTLDTISINNSILNLGPKFKVSPSVKKIICQPVLYVTVSKWSDANWTGNIFGNLAIQQGSEKDCKSPT